VTMTDCTVNPYPLCKSYEQKRVLTAEGADDQRHSREESKAHYHNWVVRKEVQNTATSCWSLVYLVYNL